MFSIIQNELNLIKRGIMKVQFIESNELSDFFTENRNALIVGNGFSMNFDKDFGNLYFRLPDAHIDLKAIGQFQVSIGAKPETKRMLNTGFEIIYEKFHGFEQIDYEHFFNSAIEFASLLKENQLLKDTILRSRHLNQIRFVPNLYEVAVRLSKVGTRGGFNKVNLEDWTVLIWLYYMVENREEVKEFATDNLFLKVLLAGDVGVFCSDNPSEIIRKYKFNGLTTYLRCLFLSAIFNRGKAVDISLLEQYEKIDLKQFESISKYFYKVFSLNYDHLIDDLFKTSITHLHGDFTTTNKESYFYMNMYFTYRKKRYSTSNILLGDFTLTKRIEPMLHTLVVSKHINEVKLLNIENTIMNAVKIKKLNNFVFFGIHPDNDFHIFKSIYDAYIAYPSEIMQVTFCYYDPQEIEAVKDMFIKVVESTGEKILDAAKIDIYFIDAKEIISSHKDIFI